MVIRHREKWAKGSLDKIVSVEVAAEDAVLREDGREAVVKRGAGKSWQCFNLHCSMAINYIMKGGGYPDITHRFGQLLFWLTIHLN